METQFERVSADDQLILDSGYQPQLRRKLTRFASFAAAFSFMSVLMGVYSNYGFALASAGPFSIWTWPIVAVGQMFVALVFAEIAGRLPLTGSLYNWNTRMSGHSVGWQAGWLTIFGYAVAGVGLIAAMMAPLGSLLGHTFSPGTVQVIGISIVLVQLFINIYGIAFAGLLNRYAVIIEMIALVVFGTALVIASVLHGGLHFALLTTIPHDPVPYLPAFFISGLLAAWTIFGYEAPSDVSEETFNARRTAPQSVIAAVSSSAILGFIFLLILTLAIPNAATIASEVDPVSSIFFYHLGMIPTYIFLVCVLIAMLAVGLLVITNAARLTFAMARDEATRGSHILKKVSGRGVPANAAIFVATIEILLIVFAYGQTALYATTIILLSLVYLITILSFALNMKKLPSPDTFSLGLWRMPVIVIAACWIVAELALFTIPAPFHLSAYTSIGVIVAGLILQRLVVKR
ncbi:MAG: amino acid permease [Patescibacteria group bacterium]